MESSKNGNISSPATESVDEREKSTVTVAGISSKAATPENRRLKTFSKQNKQFDPGRRREKAPPWNAAVTLSFFFWGELGSSLLLPVCASCSALCVCFPKLFSRVLDADQVADVRNQRASIFSPITLLKLARTSNARFGRSANALG